jgi:hypothetical protein
MAVRFAAGPHPNDAQRGRLTLLRRLTAVWAPLLVVALSLRLANPGFFASGPDTVLSLAVALPVFASLWIAAAVLAHEGIWTRNGRPSPTWNLFVSLSYLGFTAPALYSGLMRHRAATAT